MPPVFSHGTSLSALRLSNCQPASQYLPACELATGGLLCMQEVSVGLHLLLYSQDAMGLWFCR